MRLEKLVVRNFKGIREFVFTPGEKDALVLGDNGSGKSTLDDAFHWVMFGKDSKGRTDFEIKPLENNGQPLHNLEHTVEVTLVLATGQTVKLGKTYREKQTKKRGSAVAQITGHTTEHFVDDVPVKANQYQQRINQLMDEELFRLLTNPDYFNNQLHWQKRREILMDLCGEVAPNQVLAANQRLASLAGVLEKRSMEDHRKILTAQRKEINRELERIPVRIDEATRSLPMEVPQDPEAIKAQLKELENQRRDLRHQMEAAEQGSETITRQKLMALEQEAANVKWEGEKTAREQLHLLQQQESHLRHEVMTTETTLLQHQRKTQAIDQEQHSLTHKLEGLRSEYRQEAAVPFQHTEEDHCPACHQAIPQDQREAARAQALAQFNQVKAARLESIQREGKAQKTRQEALATEKVALVEAAEQLHTSLKAQEQQLAQARLPIRDQEQAMTNAAHHPQLVALTQEIDQLKQDQSQQRQLHRQAMASLEDDLAAITRQVQQLESQLATVDMVEKTRQRIAQLEAEEKELADAYEKLEGELFLTEEYIRTMVNLLEEKINEKFQMVSFKLFHQQQNGGLTETCEATVDGVPFNSLNNAARINAGLDILNTLGRHYNTMAPVFIDNAESITQLLPIDSQTIQLIVSRQHKSLTVKTTSQREEKIA